MHRLFFFINSFVVGKMNHSMLDLEFVEKEAVVHAYPNAKLDCSAMLHKRHGVLFSGTSYQRQSPTSCDYVMCFYDGQIGLVTKYLSFCLTDCTCSSPCIHVAIAEVFTSRPHHFINACPEIAMYIGVMSRKAEISKITEN